jgi:hypothetical protein
VYTIGATYIVLQQVKPFLRRMPQRKIAVWAALTKHIGRQHDCRQFSSGDFGSVRDKLVEFRIAASTRFKHAPEEES